MGKSYLNNIERPSWKRYDKRYDLHIGNKSDKIKLCPKLNFIFLEPHVWNTRNQTLPIDTRKALALLAYLVIEGKPQSTRYLGNLSSA